MKHPLPPLDALKVFESAARHLSFTVAAEELCLTKSAVSYQIRRLEQEVECALFRRAVRQVYLTDAGQELYHVIQELFSDLTSVLQKISTQDSVQIVIATTTYVATRWLSSRLARFLERYPETAFRFKQQVGGNGTRLHECDVAIVWGACLGEGDPHCVRELPMPLYPVCSPDIARDLVEGNQKLQDIRLLTESRRQDLWMEWFESERLKNPRQVIDDANVRVQAAIDGQGLILADDLMQEDLKAGRLVAPFERNLLGYGYRILRGRSGFTNTHAARLLEWLVEQ